MYVHSELKTFNTVIITVLERNAVSIIISHLEKTFYTAWKLFLVSVLVRI